MTRTKLKDPREEERSGNKEKIKEVEPFREEGKLTHNRSNMIVDVA